MTTPPPAPPHGPLWFLPLAIGITWALGLPAVLARFGVIAGPMERYLGLVGLGAFGPLAAAVLLARREPGGVRALFRLAPARGVSLTWYPAALLLSGSLLVASMAVYRLLGGTVERWLYLPVEPERIVALFVFSFGEEVGWRGYALPRLSARWGALRASLAIGVAWALWHLMMLLSDGVPAATYLLFVPFMVAGSVVFAWFFRRTSGSLLIALLLHMGAHLNNSNRALPGSLTPLALHTAAFVVLALALVTLDRRTWGDAPEQPGTRPAQLR